MNSIWSSIFAGRKDSTDDPKQILGEIPIFSDLKTADIRELEHIVHVRTYEPGECVFREGDVGGGMYVIARGRVDILLENRESEEKPERIAVLGKSDFFGELSLLDDERRSATARACEPSVLIGLFRPDLLDLIERNPRLGSRVLLNVARVIGKRLRAADARLVDSAPRRESSADNGQENEAQGTSRSDKGDGNES